MDDAKEKTKDEDFMQALEEEFEEIAQQYREKRLEELRTAFTSV